MKAKIIAILSAAVIYKMSSAHATGKYKQVKKISEKDCGKNTELTMMYSMSRRDKAVKKLWMYKPFFTYDYFNKYELPTAANEVFFGQLAVAVFGKTRAAKTKFNPEARGVCSRILGDDATKVMDMLSFCNSQAALSQDAQKTLLATILYNLIIEDRDINLENLVIKFAGDANHDVIYGIDHEFAGGYVTQEQMLLSDIIVKLDKNPRAIIQLLFDHNFNWNLFFRKDSITKDELDIYAQRLIGAITHEDFIDALKYITEKLACDNFKICYDVKDKISTFLYNNLQLYSSAEIEETVVPNIDAAITTVKNNVEVIQQFIDDKRKTTMLKATYKL